MKEYIDKEAVKESIRTGLEMLKAEPNQVYETGVANGLTMALGILTNAPAADVVERVYGEWQHKCFEWTGLDVVECSRCHKDAYRESLFVRFGNFCPYCGADMRGKKE